MYRKNKIIATSVAILMLLSSCANMSAMNNDISQVDESIYVGEKDIDNIQVDEVINNACNKIIELNNYCEIKDIEFLGDNLYILSKNQDDSVNLEQYNLVTQKTKNIEVVIKENTMLQLNIKNDYILINNVELEWKKGTLAVYDTELNYIDVYEDIYPSCAYNEESIYYYDIENNSLVTIKDNKKEYMREYNKEKIDDCVITNVENLTYLNNKLYMNVSYIQNGKESSENGYVCIDLINNEDVLYKENKKIINSNDAILLVDATDSAFDFKYNTLLPNYTFVTKDNVMEREFKVGEESLSPALSNDSGIIITMEGINHNIYDVKNNQIICTIPDENSDWYLYATVCEKYRFFMLCSYEYNEDNLQLDIKKYKY